ncbi:polyprenyl synthetase family protein [Sulfitobacter sp.]|uniref:polyprenyl synthetase family protein n=1 Tax=Sulfitobacter sp. TaxID=1903071 RepID=UPI0030032EF7
MNFDVIDTVVPVLEEYGALTRDALLQHLPKGEPKDFLYDPIADYPQRGGKMMRSSLCIATACVFGAKPEDVVAAAAGIEMVHNALLIHDDIEDESEERRGKPTLHALHGVPIALNAGDALAMFSLRPIIENALALRPLRILQIIEDMERMARESAEGQAFELGWRSNAASRPTRDQYLEMVLKKTCWLAAIFPCRVGARLAPQGRNIPPDAFIRFGFFFGAAFQIHDDVLNLTCDPAYGKEGCGDLWEGKWTLMLIDVAAQLRPQDQLRLSRFLSQTRAERSEEDVAWLLDKMCETRAIEKARMFAHGLAGAALQEFDQIFGDMPDTRDKTFIRNLITWTFQRNH